MVYIDIIPLHMVYLPQQIPQHMV